MKNDLRFDGDGYFEDLPQEISIAAPEADAPASTGILLSTEWSQSGVIKIGNNTSIKCNEYTPIDPTTSTHSVTGCTNTAAAQILYYFIEKKGLDLALTLKNSDAYTSTKDSITINVKADGSTPGTYSFSTVNSYLRGYTLNSAVHAAMLMYACGVVQQAKYSSAATSTSWSVDLFYRAGLQSANHFYLGGVSNSSYWGSNDASGNFTISAAGYEVIIENLQAGRPVGVSYPGHALVIDGYDSTNDLFHINFGWGPGSRNRWYSRSEMKTQGYYEFVYDIMLDRVETLTVTDSRAYGTGTMVRAMEQAGSITGGNTVTFSAAVNGKSVQLTEYMKIRDRTVIRDFNMAVTVTSARNFSWGTAFYAEADSTAVFENFGGALIVNTGLAVNAALYVAPSGRLSFSANNTLLYGGHYAVSGNYATGATNILNAMRTARNNRTTPNSFVTGNADYSIDASDNDDSIVFADRSLVVGSINLRAGKDTVAITGGSRLYGNIQGSGSKTVTIDSTSELTGLLYSTTDLRFVLDSAPETHALFTVKNNVSNVYSYATISVDITNAEKGSYTLFAADANASSADLLNWMTLTVKCAGQSDYTLCGNGTSTGKYADVAYTDRKLKLTVHDLPPKPSSASGDLNGDGRADVVMTIALSAHPHVGATGAWLIKANQTAAWGDLSTRSSGWTIFGKGFSVKGKTTADVYVKSSGNVVGAWLTNASGNVSGWKTVGEFNDATQVLGLGDFNGDGQTDLLLRNVNGAVGCHLTDGTGWQYFQSLGNEWSICAVGDLNGDGRDDVILKHSAGFAGSWLTQSDCTMAWADLDTLQSGFGIVGAGDFNGDGTDDVLLKKGSYYGAWLVKNGRATGWMGLGDLGNVTVEEIDDFDGDGRDDLRIRTARGDLGAQLVKGADNLQWKYYGSVGSEWSTSLAAI